MSETDGGYSSSFVDETGEKTSNNDTIEPLVRYIQEHPVCTALAALGIGFLLGKML
ncbi:MAG TPA: DUF883 C-terminal domain-containing protein [Acetobacteraceae bacterium]|nr:DUF883 C-terminal domain-containing protein [Acetobacteraceae bacterium]